MNASVFRIKARRDASDIDDTVPELGFPTEFEIDEGLPIGLTPTFNVPVAGVRFAGGADDAWFADTIALNWVDGFLPAFADPEDVGGNNTYVTTRIYTGENGVESAPITFTFTVLDVVVPVVVGTATLSGINGASDTELVFRGISASNATSFEYRVGGAGSWLPLSVVGGEAVVNATTSGTFEVRGVAGNVLGAASPSRTGTLLAAPASYSANAVVVDGSQRLEGATPTGLADGKTGTLVVEFEATAGDGTSRRLWTTTTHYATMRLKTSNTIEVKMYDSADGELLELTSAVAILANSGWKQVVISWDLGNGLYSGIINGTPLVFNITDLVDGNIDYTRPAWAWLAAVGGAAGFIGKVSDCAFHTGYIDLTDLVNIRKFYWHDGRVRDPGANGSNWFGGAALVLLHGATDAFHTNVGSGGGYTLTGTLAQSADGPNGRIDTGGGTTVTPLKADEYIYPFQSLQSHPSWQGEERWANEEWIDHFAATHIRLSRAVFANSAPARAQVNTAYDTYGIRFTCTFNEKFDASGTFDYAGTNTVFNNMKGANLGLDRVIGVEGPNEITHDFVFEHVTTANASTDVLTVGTTGHHGRGEAGLVDIGSMATNELVNGTKVQVRAGDNDGRELGDTADGVLPAPLQENTEYYIRDLGIGGTNTCKLAATSGGAVINLTSAGSGQWFLSAWAPRVRDYQAELWRQSNLEPYLTELNAGRFTVRGPSMWKRIVSDYEEIGDISSVYEVNNLHLYGGMLKPSIYNIGADNETVTAPIIQAVVDCQIMGLVPVDITETGWNMAGYEYGGSANISTGPAEVASKYIGRLFAEYWLLKLQGLVRTVSYYSLLDNLAAATRFGLMTYNTTTDVYTPRLPYGTLCNINSYCVEGVWNAGTETWTVPSFTPAPLTIRITPDSGYATPELIKWFVLQKSNGKRLLFIWNDADTYDRGEGGPPGGGGPGDGYDAIPAVQTNIKITGTSFVLMRVFRPTVLTGETIATKRDTPVATPSIANLATSGVNVDVYDEVMVVELTPA